MKSIFVWLEYKMGSQQFYNQAFEHATFGPGCDYATGAAFVSAIQRTHRSAGSTVRILNIVIEG